MAFDEEITGRIIHCAIRVHQALGPGFVEKIYQRATLIELERSNLQVEVEKEVDIFYRGVKIGRHAIDLVVEKQVVVELKSVHAFCKEHYDQIRSYLRASGLNVGLLVNFAGERADYRRVTSPPSPIHRHISKKKKFPCE